jgi:hypothetical protein
MDRIYVFLIRNDVWIYIICGLGLLWYLNELISSQRALSRAMFGLERETALRTRNKALVLVVLFATIASAVIYVNTAVRPLIPPERLRPPTPDMSEGFFPTATPTAGVVEADEPDPDATPTSPIAPTVTLSGQSVSPVTDTITATATITGSAPLPVETLMPAPAPETTLGPQVAGCSPDALISEPREGVTVLGLLNLFGSANTSDFSYYEIEIRGPQTNDRWASLVGRRVSQPVNNGILAGNVDLSSWASGTYEIRLLISNVDDQITHQCGVSIVLRTSGG